MATLENLRNEGWHLSSEGLSRLYENEYTGDIKCIIRKALDTDLRDIGAPIIISEINKDVFGPVVLQIVKIRNISASKAKPKSQTAPRLLKLSLTDGHTYCQGIEIISLPALNLDNTAPGTKLLINGAHVLSGCLLLDLKCCKILGGNVAILAEKWTMAKLMPDHIRIIEDGPPAWVNFGKKIITNLNNQGFKSLENKNKENSKEDTEFLNQRQDAISEAAQGAVKKVFGGGIKNPPFSFSEQFTYQSNSSNTRASRPPRSKAREKPEAEKVDKPSQRVSLFDFLEDKLTASETQNKNINSNIKLYSNEKNSSIEISKENDKSKIQNRDYNGDRKDYENLIRGGSGNKYQNDKNRFCNDRNFDNTARQCPENRYQQTRCNDHRKNENTWQNDQSINKFSNDRHELDSKYTGENKYQNDRPPRFQKQRYGNAAKYSSQSEPKQEGQFQNIFQDNIPRFQNMSHENRTKPDTNIFINKLANEINNISLYNSKYENEKLHKINNEGSSHNWKWNIGDQCMAKYWEDNKFYSAIVTDVTNRTCLVEFLEYGNFEEVLHADCIPITAEKGKHSGKPFVVNQQFSSNVEFRCGRSQPVIKSQTNGSTEYKKYES